MLSSKPRLLSSEVFSLTTTWHRADWWNAQQFESGASIQMSVICLIVGDTAHHQGACAIAYLEGFVSESTSLLPCRCAAACEENMASTTYIFCLELRHFNTLKLNGDTPPRTLYHGKETNLESMAQLFLARQHSSHRTANESLKLVYF